nr:hypothetical protein [Planococcus glaciei]
MANRKLIADGQAEDIFYNQEVLKASMLKPPAVAQMAGMFHFPPGILSKQQLVAAILKHTGT